MKCKNKSTYSLFDSETVSHKSLFPKLDYLEINLLVKRVSLCYD